MHSHDIPYLSFDKLLAKTNADWRGFVGTVMCHIIHKHRWLLSRSILLEAMSALF